MGRLSFFDIQNPDLTLELRQHIVFSPILTFKLGRIPYFEIKNPYLTFQHPEGGPEPPPPHPHENHKNIGFSSNTGLDPLTITKLQIRA